MRKGNISILSRFYMGMKEVGERKRRKGLENKEFYTYNFNKTKKVYR